MSRKAVLIGCNYEGTDGELHGCVNDVNRMYSCLVDRFGFSEDDIEVLIDTDESYTQPTGRNIRRALTKLVQSAEPGDVLFIHFSGHGTRLPAETGEDDDTGYDECVVPTDMNLITDDDFRDLVDQLPEGCTLTFVSDSCHSGGLIDESVEQIGESHKENQGTGSDGGVEEQPEDNGKEVRSRDLPIETLIEILRHKTGRDDLDVGQLRPTLYDLFGDDVSPKVKKFMKLIMSKYKEHEDDEDEEFMGALGQYLRQRIEEDEEYAQMIMDIEFESNAEAYAGAYRGAIPDGSILISGCQTHQTSADARPEDSEPYGALSNAIVTILNESDGEVTNADLVLRAREIMKEQGYTQRPGLYCNNDLTDAPFVCC